jgi:hypothetical protein
MALRASSKWSAQSLAAAASRGHANFRFLSQQFQNVCG